MSVTTALAVTFRLEMAVDQPLQLETIAAAARKLFAVFQHGNILATLAGLQLPDSTYICDQGTMNAHETPRIKFRRHTANPFPQQIEIFTDVQLYVVGGGLYPIDFVGVEENYAASCSDDQALRLRCRLGVPLPARMPGLQILIVRLKNLGSRPLKRAMQMFLIDWLQ